MKNYQIAENSNAINKMLTPVYSVDTLHCYTGENYFTHDRKYKICHYPNLFNYSTGIKGYWEVVKIGTCDINDFITREESLQNCIDFLNTHFL